MRLIDADTLKEEVNKKNVVGRFNTLSLIDNAPTVYPICSYDCKYATVYKRTKGEWKPFDLTFGRSIYYCSECKNSVDLPIENGRPLFNFCPNCGADMRGQEE